MSKIFTLILLFVLSGILPCFAGFQPILQNPWTTNTPSALPIPSAVALTNVYNSFDMVVNFGAIPDGIRLRYCTIAKGSTSLAVQNNAFSPSSVGKIVMLKECGPNTNSFTTTCASYVNPTHITLTSPVPQGVTNSTSYFNGPSGNPVFGYTADGGVIGSDSTAAFQAALNQITNGVSISIHVPNGLYLINGPVGGTNVSQLYVPPVTPQSMNPPMLRFWGDDTPVLNQRILNNQVQQAISGATIYSTVPTLTNGTGYPGSMIDCRNFVSPIYTANLPFNGVVVDLENLRIEGCFDNGGCLVNLGGAWNEVLKNVSMDSGYVNYCNPQPQNTNTWALYLTPPSSDGTVLLQGSIIIDGFYNGMDFGEHTELSGNLFVGDCWNAFNTYSFYTNSFAFSAGGISSIPAYLHGVDAEHNHFYIQNGSGKIGNINMDITHIENSFPGDWTMPPVLLNDPNGGLAGYLYYSSSLGSALLITNGANVELHAYGNYLSQNTNNYENVTFENTSNLTANAFQMFESGPFGITLTLSNGNAIVQDNSILMQSVPNATSQWVFGKHPDSFNQGSLFWKEFVGGVGSEKMSLTTNGTLSIANNFIMATNPISVAPQAVIGSGVFWNSNDVLYWVTQFHTNYVSGP